MEHIDNFKLDRDIFNNSNLKHEVEQKKKRTGFDGWEDGSVVKSTGPVEEWVSVPIISTV